MEKKNKGEAVLKNIISLTKSKLKIYRLPNDLENGLNLIIIQL